MATAELTGEHQTYEPGVADVDISIARDLGQVVAYGGLGTSQLLRFMYDPLLHDPNSELSEEERFFPPLHFGLAPIEEMNGHAIEVAERVAEQVQGPLDAEGHSLGGPILIHTVLERPDLFKSVTIHGGVNFGVTKMTPGALILEKTVGKVAGGTGDIHADSDYMIEQRRRVAEEWPEDIPVSLVATLADDLVLMKDALRIELPPGQRAERNVVVPWWFANDRGRRLLGIPQDVGFISTKLPVTHYNMPQSRQLIEHHRVIRAGIYSAAQSAVNSLTSGRPHLRSV